MYNICIDATGIVNFPTGLGKYSFHLIRAMTMSRNFHFTILHQKSLKKDHPLLTFAPRSISFMPIDSPVIGPRRELKLLLLSSTINRMDLYHCLSSYLPAFNIKIPSIITVHDLKYLLYPHFFGQRLKTAYYSWVVKRGILKAARIIAVSGSTKKDIVNLGVSYEKITVIYEANTLDYDDRADALPEVAGGKPYMLFVGEDRPHKNIDRLVKSHVALYDSLGEQCPRLVLAGADSQRLCRIYSDIANEKGIIFAGPVDDDELKKLYRNALALVYPSLYEGFGLPILEAMAAGTPVITSNYSATAEIAGGAARLVDPYNVNEIAEAMLKISRCQGERNKLRQLGLNRARNFSWQKAAISTLELYEKAIERNTVSLKNKEDA